MATVTIGGRAYEVEVRGDKVVVDGREYPVTVRDDGGYRTVKAGEVQYRIQLPPAAERVSGMEVQVDYRAVTVEYEGRLGGGPAPREHRPAASGGPASAPRPGLKGGVTAQIAGKVLRVIASVGDSVKQGDVLLVVEAMKMENEIKAPADGTVKEVPVTEGQRVVEGDLLAVVE
jgi:biotin carboxyl carrier protein